MGASTARSVVMMAKMPSASRTGTERVIIQTSTAACVKVGVRPDARVRGEGHCEPVLRLDAIGGRGEVKAGVAVGRAIDVGAGDNGSGTVQQRSRDTKE